jgi:hypothetical protein
MMMQNAKFAFRPAAPVSKQRHNRSPSVGPFQYIGSVAIASGCNVDAM